MDPPPPEGVREAARGLKYRSLLCVNLLIDAEQENPDTWVYVHSPEVDCGRIQFYKNWSPWMVPNPDQSAIGMEYFCNEGDALWTADNGAMIAQARSEIEKLQLVDPSKIFDAFVVRMPKCYPVYDSGYSEKLAQVKAYLDTLENLQPVGRNGMFKYNNADHSILTSLYAVRNLLGENLDIWGINTDQEYHEEKRS
jgi:protoporphyrinogen oxidase